MAAHGLLPTIYSVQRPCECPAKHPSLPHVASVPWPRVVACRGMVAVIAKPDAWYPGGSSGCAANVPLRCNPVALVTDLPAKVALALGLCLDERKSRRTGSVNSLASVWPSTYAKIRSVGTELRIQSVRKAQARSLTLIYITATSAQNNVAKAQSPTTPPSSRRQHFSPLSPISPLPPATMAAALRSCLARNWILVPVCANQQRAASPGLPGKQSMSSLLDKTCAVSPSSQFKGMDPALLRVEPEGLESLLQDDSDQLSAGLQGLDAKQACVMKMVGGDGQLPGRIEADELCINLDGLVINSKVNKNAWGPTLLGLSSVVRGNSVWIDHLSDPEVRRMFLKLEAAYVKNLCAFNSMTQLPSTKEQALDELYRLQFDYQQKLYDVSLKTENLKKREQDLDCLEMLNAERSREVKLAKSEIHQRELAYGRRLQDQGCKIDEVFIKVNELSGAVKEQKSGGAVCKFVERQEKDSSPKRKYICREPSRLTCKLYHQYVKKIFHLTSADGPVGLVLQNLAKVGRVLVFIDKSYKFLKSYTLIAGGAYVLYNMSFSLKDVTDLVDMKLMDSQAKLTKELGDYRDTKAKEEEKKRQEAKNLQAKKVEEAK